jgi:MFS family permease
MSSTTGGRSTIALKYYLYSVTLSHGFVVAIGVQYLRFQGLSFTQIGTIQAVFMASLVLGEVPTGYIGDRIGRRNSLLVGSLLAAFSMALVGAGSTFLVFALAHGIWVSRRNLSVG